MTQWCNRYLSKNDQPGNTAEEKENTTMQGEGKTLTFFTVFYIAVLLLSLYK